MIKWLIATHSAIRKSIHHWNRFSTRRTHGFCLYSLLAQQRACQIVLYVFKTRDAVNCLTPESPATATLNAYDDMTIDLK